MEKQREWGQRERRRTKEFEEEAATDRDGKMKWLSRKVGGRERL